MRIVLHALLAAAALLATDVSAATLDRIRDSKTFRIGYRVDAAPFSFRTDEGGAAGYSVELCRAVAAEVERKLDSGTLTLEYLPVGTEDQFEAVRLERIDILCGPTTATLGRRELVDFSIPIFIDGASVLYRADGPDTFDALAGNKIGVRHATTTEEQLRNTLRDLSVEAEIVPVEDHKEGLRKLKAGEIAAYFGDRGILQFLIAGGAAGGQLRLSEHYFSFEPYALGLARGDDEFRLLVDRALSRLFRSDGIQPVFARSFGGEAKPSELVKSLYIISGLPE